MHACGHDGHTAMALTAARVLARRRERLPGNVVFAFQPAEETTGGAARMIQEGALRDPRVDAAIGFHLANTLPVGQIAAQPGPDHRGHRRLRAHHHRQRGPRRPAPPLGRPGGRQLPGRAPPCTP